MFGQSALAAWSAYTAAERVARACGASKEFSSGFALGFGSIVNGAVAAVTFDAPGLVAGPGLLIARSLERVSSDGAASAVIDAIHEIREDVGGNIG